MCDGAFPGKEASRHCEFENTWLRGLGRPQARHDGLEIVNREGFASRRGAAEKEPTMSLRWIAGFIFGLVLMPGVCMCGVGTYFHDAPIDCGDSSWSTPSQAYVAHKSTGLHSLTVSEYYFLGMWYFDNVMDGYVIIFGDTYGGFENYGETYFYGFFQANAGAIDIDVWLYKENQDEGLCYTRLWFDDEYHGQKDASDDLLESVLTYCDD
jgi:hypothetical protein